MLAEIRPFAKHKEKPRPSSALAGFFPRLNARTFLIGLQTNHFSLDRGVPRRLT